MGLSSAQWKEYFGVDVPITVHNGAPLCAYNGCPGCSKCRAVSKGAPTIEQSRIDEIRKRGLAKLTPEERRALGFK